MNVAILILALIAAVLTLALVATVAVLRLRDEVSAPVGCGCDLCSGRRVDVTVLWDESDAGDPDATPRYKRGA